MWKVVTPKPPPFSPKKFTHNPINKENIFYFAFDLDQACNHTESHFYTSLACPDFTICFQNLLALLSQRLSCDVASDGLFQDKTLVNSVTTNFMRSVTSIVASSTWARQLWKQRVHIPSLLMFITRLRVPRIFSKLLRMQLMTKLTSNTTCPTSIIACMHSSREIMWHLTDLLNTSRKNRLKNARMPSY